jgi:hypothetical protein
MVVHAYNPSTSKPEVRGFLIAEHYGIFYMAEKMRWDYADGFHFIFLFRALRVGSFLLLVRLGHVPGLWNEV